MAAIITNKFRIHNAEQFYESFSEAAASTYYLFVGRPQAFSTTTGGGTDISVPTPVDNIDDEYMYWRDALAAKKVASTDVSYVVPRINWTVGDTYAKYRHDYSSTNQAYGSKNTLWDASFYVMTSEYKVYKCMNNNGAQPVTTGNEPDHVTNVEAETGDGYMWKYMYTMTTSQVQNFLSTDFMPVATDSTVSGAAVDGEIRHAFIDTAGTGYTNSTYTGVPIRGDGSGGTVDLVVSGNVVTSATVTAPGTGYTHAYINVDAVSSIGGNADAVVTPIVGPKEGHGNDALKELGAFYVMMNTSLSGAEGSGDFIVDNDFRRVALVRNPYNYGTTTVSTAATLGALRSVTFAASPTPGTFIVDEIITGNTSGAKGEVVAWDSTNRILKYIQTEWGGIDSNKNITAFAGTEVVQGSSSLSPTGTIASGGITNPEIAYHSGDIMYVENRAPIVRASDQTENIKLVIEF